MNIHTTPIGHTIEYAQFHNIERWLLTSNKTKMPYAKETMKAFLSEKPFIIKTNSNQVSYKNFIHYCLSNPAMIDQEASFTNKIAKIFSQCDMGFVVDLLLTENKRGLNCYNDALKKDFLQLAAFFEKTIEVYNLKNHNQNVPGVLNAFTNPNISISTFATKIAQINPTVFEATLATKNGEINCAQAIFIFQLTTPNDNKLNTVKSLLGKEKFESLLNNKNSLLSLFSIPKDARQTKDPFILPLSPLDLNNSIRSC